MKPRPGLLQGIAGLMCLALLGTAGLAQVVTPLEPATRMTVEQAWVLLNGGGQTEPAILAGCCKTCSKGKACGDSCISRDKTCTQPAGCACNG